MSVLSIQKPDAALPLVFDSPHSGRTYPDDFNFACDFKTLQAAEDNYVDELFENAPSFGAAMLQAHFPRSYIDVNRRSDDIDLELINEKWGGPFPASPSSRSHAGIGLIRRLVKPGTPVYGRYLTSEEIVARIEKYYRPYHNALEKLLKDAHYDFGQVWHINCHSMPESSAYPKRGMGLIGNKPKPVDFVLGDQDATSCTPAFTREIAKFIKGLGYSVSINDPFKGVELIGQYSDPAAGYHSLQIEINKALYVDEETGEKKDTFDHLKTDIEKLTAFIAGYVESNLTSLAAD